MILLDDFWMNKDGSVEFMAYLGKNGEDAYHGQISDDVFQKYLHLKDDASLKEWSCIDEDYCELGYTFKYRYIPYHDWFYGALTSEQRKGFILDFINNYSNLHEVIKKDLTAKATA